jgi:hypothetical protein
MGDNKTFIKKFLTQKKKKKKKKNKKKKKKSSFNCSIS